MSWHPWPLRARCIPSLAAVLVLRLPMAAVAAPVDGERLLVFSTLPETLQGAAEVAFAEVGDSQATRPARKRPDTRRVKAAEFDLNQDGSPELLLIQEDDAGCILNSCPVWILQRQGEGWQRIGAFLGNPHTVRVYQRRDFGYHRLSNQPVRQTDRLAGWHTIQVWWRGHYWDLAILNGTARTWPFEPLQVRPPTEREQEIIAQRVWLEALDRSALFREGDEDHRFHVATFDLNDDGEEELILVATDFASCGSAGCRGEILRHQRDQWVVIGEMGLKDWPPPVRILFESHNGYRMLLFFGLIVWTGEEYYNYGNERDDQDY